METVFNFYLLRKILVCCLVIGLIIALPVCAAAATLQTSPATGVYKLQTTFAVRVTVNTGGQMINAAEGELRFDPSELSVVSVDRSDSVFNLWVTEPTFSNSAGTISFSGGSPTGYNGAAGTVMMVTIRVLRAGSSRLTFATGAVLANDGQGTNILSGMSGSTFTIEAVATSPKAEIIEYVAPPNTPSAPIIESSSHRADTWSQKKTAELSWTLPAGVTAVRTLLDQRPATIPTKLYETPIRSLTLTDLPEGESYFHIQFQNADGWGKVTHHRLAVDSEKPETVTVSLPVGADLTNPEQKLLIEVVEKTSPINRYLVRVDDKEPIEQPATALVDGLLTLPSLLPGYHTVFVEAFDAAGNGQIGTLSFTLEAFTAPTFTDYPTELTAGVIPVFRGQTRPQARVLVEFGQVGGGTSEFEVFADATGGFVFIPEKALAEGVYELKARAIDQFGAQSNYSEVIRVAAQQPGFMRIGSLIVSVLSVVVPLVAMSILLILLTWWLIISSRRLRQRLSREAKEAEEILRREFEQLRRLVSEEQDRLVEFKRTKKLSEQEQAVFSNLSTELRAAESRIFKEVKDVSNIVKRQADVSSANRPKPKI